ncbi:hypothetical protein [Haloferula sp.]|uniref:hypothetical protein n=1 Tax=Haloferula sp. TaxID=2497595 RepID=UPI00329C6E99
MKTIKDRKSSAVGRLVEWCEASSPPFSLAVGATCGCDLSQIEKEVCECVNEAALHPGEEFGCFDYEDVRYLAGDPAARRFIIERAGMAGPEYDRWNDYALVLRALASLGGFVLCGQGAIDAARGLPNVCEVMICKCSHCEDAAISSWIDPDLCESESVVTTVAGHFLQWLSESDRVRASKRRAMGIPEQLVAV